MEAVATDAKRFAPGLGDGVGVCFGRNGLVECRLEQPIQGNIGQDFAEEADSRQIDRVVQGSDAGKVAHGLECTLIEPDRAAEVARVNSLEADRIELLKRFQNPNLRIGQPLCGLANRGGVVGDGLVARAALAPPVAIGGGRAIAAD
ncbi:hypothetical protein AMJ85_11405 [candidate division BRC1 bacterium SM23_51]|nr:MAG: hypothetical protein AMJ85_11405 [candidate division BRC1 bacterium SM23_51]